METERWLETGDIAADLGVHTRTVANWLESGKIPVRFRRVGERGHRRVPESEYKKWLEANDQRAA